MAYTSEHLKQAMEKNHATRQDFLKTLLTIGSAMLAILASFNNTSCLGSLTFLFVLFLTTLVLLALGILSGGIVLYFDTVAAKSMFVQTKQAKLSQQNFDDTTDDSLSYNPPALFYICEKLCYISFLLSVVSIALFAGFKSSYCAF